MPYNYSNAVAAALASGGILLALLILLILLGIIFLGILPRWKIYKKAGEPGWASLVPFYNNYVLFKITWGEGILFLLLLIPIANFFIAIITWLKLARSFGKGSGFGVGLVFFPFIFQLVMAFDNSYYIGPDGIPRDAPGYQKQPYPPQPPYQAYQPQQQPYQQPSQQSCPNCGAAFGSDARFCPSCGKQV